MSLYFLAAAQNECIFSVIDWIPSKNSHWFQMDEIFMLLPIFGLIHYRMTNQSHKKQQRQGTTKHIIRIPNLDILNRIGSFSHTTSKSDRQSNSEKCLNSMLWIKWAKSATFFNKNLKEYYEKKDEKTW